ncbi:MAG: H/ACA ribonucleoprotein complex subunit GAR1 [Candidatus Thorarchaeota archaeon]|jgi:RNA-binding protein
MRRLGKVIQVTKGVSLIVQTDKTPPIGAKVVDKKAQPVGKIQDVFGPVKNPYIAIRFRSKSLEDAEKLLGQMVYLYKK